MLHCVTKRKKLNGCSLSNGCVLWYIFVFVSLGTTTIGDTLGTDINSYGNNSIINAATMNITNTESTSIYYNSSMFSATKMTTLKHSSEDAILNTNNTTCYKKSAVECARLCQADNNCSSFRTDHQVYVPESVSDQIVTTHEGCHIRTQHMYFRATDMV